jgi:hypothetical protein
MCVCKEAPRNPAGRIVRGRSYVADHAPACLTLVIAAALISYGIAAAGNASDGALEGILTAGVGIAALYLFVVPRFFDDKGN